LIAIGNSIENAIASIRERLGVLIDQDADWEFDE
jgi:hypothetical protein